MAAVSAAKCQWSRDTSAAKCLGPLRNGLSFHRSSHSRKLYLSDVQRIHMVQLTPALCCSEGTRFRFRWGGVQAINALVCPKRASAAVWPGGPWAPLLPSARGPVELLLPFAWVSLATHLQHIGLWCHVNYRLPQAHLCCQVPWGCLGDSAVK